MRCVLLCASLWVAMQTSYWERTAPLKPKPGLIGPPAVQATPQQCFSFRPLPHGQRSFRSEPFIRMGDFPTVFSITQGGRGMTSFFPPGVLNVDTVSFSRHAHRYLAVLRRELHVRGTTFDQRLTKSHPLRIRPFAD